MGEFAFHCKSKRHASGHSERPHFAFPVTSTQARNEAELLVELGKGHTCPGGFHLPRRFCK